jgi:diguanylate cyclase (GGDEF)-like protein
MSLFQTIKNTTLVGAQSVVFLRFWLMLCDPVYNVAWGTLKQGRVLPIYESWRGLIDALYLAGAIIQLPIQWLFQALLVLKPDLQTSIFPVMETSQLGPLVKQLIASTASLPWPEWMSSQPATQWLPGYVDWISLITWGVLVALVPLLDLAYGVVSNLWWTLITEFSFNEKKEVVYKDALQKRAQELSKLGVQYRNLSKEVNLMAESIITDELTKVYNKRFYLSKSQELFVQAKTNRLPMSLIMIDIDYFKKVNDHHGHLVGDEVLVAVAQIAKDLTPPGTFCCRFGGEEFAVLMPYHDLNSALQVANSIRKQCLTLTFASVPELRSSLSCGVVFADFECQAAQMMTTYENLVKLADDELYRAKLEGRNRVCFTQVVDMVPVPGGSDGYSPE